MSMANLELINSMEAAEVQAAFLRCFGSSRWAAAMTNQRPFDSETELHVAMDKTCSMLSRADWLEAFASHPRIGDLDSLRQKFATTAAWCANEQSGVAQATDTVLLALAERNRRYEERFGYLFIVCASRKSASEMLEILNDRLKNDPDEEFTIAAREQARIARLRLEKL
jgi:2-oxo-4-hydroxy-4-carboxy-5-ureidoimidazoline decarboxylase